MSKSPRQRADACFALARSTTHDGERSAAIGRGEAICQKHGLSLDLFEIPGRARASRSAPRSNVADTVDDVLRRYAGAFHRAAEAANAKFGEDLEETRRRNFEVADAEAKARDARRRVRQSASMAASRLFQHGVKTYPVGIDGEEPWIVFHDGASVEVTHEGLIELERAIAARQQAAA